MWIHDFLQDRPQSVRVGKQTSKEITLNVGAPQGCVLPPLLFLLFTNDNVSSEPFIVMVTFSDDTTLEGPPVSGPTGARLRSWLAGALKRSQS